MLTALILEHGLEPAAAKSDLYTLAGIDSNHPTKLRSSIWRPTEVIEGGSEGIKVHHSFKLSEATFKRGAADGDVETERRVLS